MAPKSKVPSIPLIYLITNGETTARTTPATEEFSNVLRLVEAAVVAKIDLLQIREKQLSAKVLHHLSTRAAQITRGSATRLLINDRADIARSAGADGVHLTSQSLPPDVVRRTFGAEFLIGVSTHSLEEASAAKQGSADFVVLGPVFDTLSKRQYCEPIGLTELRRVASDLAPFPVLALGGVTTSNAGECIQAGAAGIAAIGILNDRLELNRVVNEIREGLHHISECQ
jgi:thiamine-phosphate pyrophosphorylase